VKWQYCPCCLILSGAFPPPAEPMHAWTSSPHGRWRSYVRMGGWRPGRATARARRADSGGPMRGWAGEAGGGAPTCGWADRRHERAAAGAPCAGCRRAEQRWSSPRGWRTSPGGSRPHVAVRRAERAAPARWSARCSCGGAPAVVSCSPVAGGAARVGSTRW